MLSKLKSLFSFKKKNNSNIKKDAATNFEIIIYFLIIIFFSISIYYFFKNVLLVLITAITIAISLLAFNNIFSSNKNLKKEELYNRIDFYKKFVLYSSLNTSYIEGYKLAINNLEISSLQEELKNKLESNSNESLLPLTRNREEIILLDNLYYGLNNDELTDIEAINVSEKLLNDFINKVDSKKTTFNKAYVFIPFILTIFLSIVFFTNCK